MTSDHFCWELITGQKTRFLPVAKLDISYAQLEETGFLGLLDRPSSYC
ncbi:hypothetical protein [Scytonema hofmannii]|nr:hypothetical protein [Scytonema hofmannii]